MSRSYYDNPGQFLKDDNSYLVVPHNTSNIFSRAFWDKASDKNLPHSFAGTEGNQREAYESGVKIGWDLAMGKVQHKGNNPHPVLLSKQEADDIMFIMHALGISFEYMMEPPSYLKDIKYDPWQCHPGLNIVKNVDDIDAGIVVSDDVRKQIIDILKQNIPVKN